MARNRSNSVEEEYLCATRTNSFTNLCARVEHQRRYSNDAAAARPTDYTPLLEPKQEALVAIIGNTKRRLPRLLLDFSNTTLLACHSCGALIDSIHRARANQRALHLRGDEVRGAAVAERLRRFRRLGNPFAGDSRAQLESIREAYDPLTRQLRAARRRRSMAMRMRLLFAGEAVAGRREEAQVGAAARGAFAVERELETMRSMVRRVGDEIEHTRGVVELFVEDERRGLTAREVVRELRVREGGLTTNLAELEEHVLLCFLNINRARRMVMHASSP